MSWFGKLFQRIHDYRTGPFQVDTSNIGPLPPGERAEDAVKQSQIKLVPPAKVKVLKEP